MELISRIPGRSRAQFDPAIAASNNRVYIEADGELLGTIPAEISMAPNALTLLVP